MKNGFSLVELSIVLVILGLLTGGILSGQSLIRAAELRSVSSDVQRYQAAFHTFREKYMAVPGDMRNATSFWGTASGGCPNGIGTGTQTCNGNGNGIIYNDTTVFHEGFRFWQHLANAGLIEGSYTGVQPGTTPYSLLGVNVPPGRISNTGFQAGSWGNGGASGAYGAGFTLIWGPQSYTIVGLFFGAPSSGSSMQAAALKPEESWMIDTKMDDGKPDFGKVQGAGINANSACYTAFPSPGSYNLANDDKICALAFILVSG